MDRDTFDHLARLMARSGTRRAALAAALGGALLGSASSLAATKGRVKAQPTPCYAGQRCTPGKGKSAAGCDFANSLAFFEGDFRGSNLGKSNFTGAQMALSDFRGANLGGACLVGANLVGARLGSSVNLRDATFCHTLMPDGTYNERDCGEGTACCPAPLDCEGDLCPTSCISAPNAQCSPNVPYGGCCPGLHCVPSSTTPIRFTCQAPCGADGSCRARFGTPWHCASEPVICRYLGGQCCQHI
jgi:hypothetical protein